MAPKQRLWDASRLHEVAATAAREKAGVIQRLCGRDGLPVACRCQCSNC